MHLARRLIMIDSITELRHCLSGLGSNLVKAGAQLNIEIDCEGKHNPLN